MLIGGRHVESLASHARMRAFIPKRMAAIPQDAL
jgi:hypothetical protein